MADLTDAELAYLHSELGSDADEDDMQDRFDRLGSTKAVVIEVLRQRLSDFLASPAQLGAEGANIGTAANITGLREQLKRVAAESAPDDTTGEVESTGGLVTVPLHGRQVR